MLNPRRFKTWNIFDGALINNANGHHYWETRGLVDELMRRGETVRLFSHLQAPTVEEFPGAAIVPAFSLFLYQSVSHDPTWGKLENFIVHNRAFFHDLSKLEPSLFHESVVLFPTVQEHHLLGIVRWLSTFPQENQAQSGDLLDTASGVAREQPVRGPLPNGVEGLPARAEREHRVVWPDAADR